MSDGTAIAAFYELGRTDGVGDVLTDVFATVGFETEQLETTDWDEVEREAMLVSFDEWSIDLDVVRSDDRSPDEPPVSIGLGQRIYPSYFDDETSYQRQMDVVFELICRLASELDAGYVALFDSEGRCMSVVPEGRPINDALDDTPILGVYSAETCSQLDGLDAMYETQPWFTATLAGGQTVVVEAERPWTDGGWKPPTNADYLEDVTFNDVAEDDLVGDQRRDLADPFAALDIGAVGTDLCVSREKISSEFRNDDLKLVCVRVDENHDLRRTDTGTFVRNIVDDDPGDDVAFIKSMIKDVPADATEDDLMVSALLHESIPAEFVALNGPDSENVVSKVMDLDTDVSKVQLLISLGRAARKAEDPDFDVDTIEGALSTIAGIENRDDRDQLIREKFL